MSTLVEIERLSEALADANRALDIAHKVGSDLANAGHGLRTRNAELQRLLDDERDRSDKLGAFVCLVATWPELSLYQRFALVMRAKHMARDGTA